MPLNGKYPAMNAITQSAIASQVHRGQLGYDNERRLTTWQIKHYTPSRPPTADNFLYDGLRSRAEQSVTIIQAAARLPPASDREVRVASK